MRALSELWRELESETRSLLGDSFTGTGFRFGGWVPAVDIYESEMEFVILVDVPGVRKQDVEVELAGGVLSIRGQKRLFGPLEGERYYRLECTYGPFERSFAIRSPVDREAVKASFRNGVLRVTLPKAGQGCRSIPVERS